MNSTGNRVGFELCKGMGQDGDSKIGESMSLAYTSFEVFMLC